VDPTATVRRGELVLGNVVRSAAVTQAVMDGFIAVGVLTAVALLIVVLRSAAPEGPASAMPLFRPRGPTTPPVPTPSASTPSASTPP
jgi:hypothetical protein